MSKHNHNHCCHATIKYCAHCDVAYCVNCNKEWGAFVAVYTNPQTNPYIYPNAVTAMGSVTVYNSATDVQNGVTDVLEKTMRHAHQ